MPTCADPLDIIPDELEDFVVEAFVESAAIMGGWYTEETWKSIGYPQVAAIWNLLGFVDEEFYGVQVITAPLIDDVIPDSLQRAVLTAVREKDDIVARIQQAVLTGAMATANKYLDYGKTSYTHGLPTASMSYTTIDANAIETIIEGIEGEAITILSTSLAVMESDFWVKDWLYANYPYDSVDDTYQMADDYWYTYDSYVAGTADGTYDVSLSTTEDIGEPPVPTLLEEELTTSAHNLTGNYYMVTYELVSDSGVTLNWSYEKGLGTYTDLDSSAGAGVFTQDMLPIVPLREEFYSTNDDTGPSYSEVAATTSREIMNQVNLNYDEVISSIEENDDIALIEDAFFLFAVNLYNTSQSSLKALYVMFHQFYLSGGISKAEYEANPSGQDINTVKIDEQTYTAVLSYNWIDETDVEGSIGDEGTYNSTITVLDNTAWSTDANNVTTGGGVNSYIIYRYQYSATNYTELRVQGLFSLTSIQTVPGTFKIFTTEISSDPTTMANFSIPLSLDVLEDFSYHDKETVLYESLSLTMYAVDSVYLDWYETGAFNSLVSVVLQVVSLVMLYYSWGATTTYSAFLWELAKQMLIQYALNLVLEELLLQAETDTDKAVIVAAYLYAQYYFGGSGGEGGFFSAETLMNLVTAIDVDIAIQADLLEEEQLDFLKSAEERQEDLDNARDLLDGSQGIDPLGIITAMKTDPYETPQDFYQRTVHTGNPGVAVLTQVETYVDRLLELPELEEYPGTSSPTI